MKRIYYTIFLFSIVAIFLLQSIFINSLYQIFRLSEVLNIEESIYQAIDLELHNREVNRANVEYTIISAQIPFDTFSSSEQDSLIKIYPFLAAPPSDSLKAVMRTSSIPKQALNNYDIRTLLNRGIIRSRGDIQTQKTQDEYIKKGQFINVQTLDSLFRCRLNRDYAVRLSLLDSLDRVISSVGDSIKYNYSIKPIAIGIDALQHIEVDVRIRPSWFIQSSIATLALSIIVVAIPLLSLLYFVTVLRRREKTIQYREISINGIIHDLKTPLIGVCSMLDCYSIMESDSSKRMCLKEGRDNIYLLTKRIGRLLYAAKDSIEVRKELLTTGDFSDHIEILTADMKRQYSNRKPQIIILNGLNSSLNIDMQCFDSIFVNLVENALKYSSEVIKIEVEFKRIGSMLSIRIKDNGIGIDRSRHRDIFKMYYRAHSTHAKGYGIGLTYVKALAKAHGGDAILIQSNVGEGSIFGVTLNIE